MLFECFGSASPKAFEAGDSSFLVRSVGDVSAVFRAAVSHGLGTRHLPVSPFDCLYSSMHGFLFDLLLRIAGVGGMGGSP